jgi:hypothetical protein
MKEEHRITAETAALRGRGWLRTAVRTLGIIVLLLGAYNGILAPAAGVDALLPVYRTVLPTHGLVSTGDQALVGPAIMLWLADYVAMAVGAALAWFA